jgi:hypothetical protein
MDTHELVDPITLEPIRFPFVASDGNVYELESIVEWVGKHPTKASPLTRETLRPMAFWHEALALSFGLPEPETRAVLLYTGDPVEAYRVEEKTVAVDVWLDKQSWMRSAWLSMLMQTKGLKDERLMVEIVAVCEDEK